MLKSDILDYPHALQLIKLYLENVMPVTKNSVQTLSDIFHKFYSKCALDDFRIKCLQWLTSNDTGSLYVTEVSELLFRIIANENIAFNSIGAPESEFEKLRDILYNSTERCVLFSEFEIHNSVHSIEEETVHEHVETISDVEDRVQEYLKTNIATSHSKGFQNDADLLECIKLINVILSYLDKLLKYHIKTKDEVENMQICILLIAMLARMFTAFTRLLASKTEIPVKIHALQLVRTLLVTEFHPFISHISRTSMDADFFHAVNNILNTEVQIEDFEVIIEGDEDDTSIDTLKHNCFLVLAAYCRKPAEYREEILKLILDYGSYSFPSDTQCVFQCIVLLIDSNVHDPPLGNNNIFNQTDLLTKLSI